MNFRHLYLPLLALFAGAGCFRSHTIEPGTWKLAILPKEENPENRKYVPPPANVEVSVDWGKEKDTEDVKVVITNPAKADEPEGKKYALTGVLKDGQIRPLKGFSDYWEVQVFATVNSSRLVSGTMWARMRPPNDNVYFEGIWKITKVTPARTH